MSSKLTRARETAKRARAAAKSDVAVQGSTTVVGGGLAPAIDGRLGTIAGIEASTVIGGLSVALAAFGPAKYRAAAMGFGTGLLAVQASEVTQTLNLLTGAK